MSSPLIAFDFPRLYPRSVHYRVKVAGEAVDTLTCEGADFAMFALREGAEVEVEVCTLQNVKEATIRPLSKGISCEVEAHTVRFCLEPGQDVFLDTPELGRKAPLYLFAYAEETDAPDPDDPKVHYFAAGQTYEVDQFDIDAGETIYIEGGAVVCGALYATDVEGVTIRGQGIIDGSYFTRRVDGHRCIQFIRSPKSRIEGVLAVNPSAWMVVVNCSDDCDIDRLKTIGVGGGSDALDIVSSKRINIRDCFLRSGDDCIVIKAGGWDQATQKPGGGRDVADVVSERCTLLNDGGGSNLEIGHELRTDRVERITFRDCDCVHKHGQGAAFSIANGAQAIVQDVLYEDIRVEHYYTYLINFRVMESRYSHSTKRGQVRNVKFKKIRVTNSISNGGYSLSVIGGFNDDATIEGVHFEDFRIDDQVILDGDALDLHTKNTKDITFA